MATIPRVIRTALVIALLGLLAAPAAAPALERCADVRFDYRERGTRQYVLASNVRVRATGCPKARRLARTYARAYRNGYGHPEQVGSFTCRWTRWGSDIGGARCRNPAGEFVSFGIYDSSPYH